MPEIQNSQTPPPLPPITGSEPRTWLRPPGSYQFASGKIWVPAPYDTENKLQGAVYGRRSDYVNCFKTIEVDVNADDATKEREIQAGIASVETMLQCPCTAGSQCQEHGGKTQTNDRRKGIDRRMAQ